MKSAMKSVRWARRGRRLAAILAVNLALLALLLAAVEGAFHLLLARPALAAAGGTRVLELARALYMRERSIVQLEPACARPDPDLTYTLRPGRCRFANREFSVELEINSAGLRDDEASLAAPEIIVLGDSHAMGWGVEGEETFARILERETGRRVLNAGVSSYGTAREMKLLTERLDTSGLRHLVLQYSANDEEENRAWKRAGGVLPISERRRYEEKVAFWAERRRYRPGEYLLYLAGNARKRLARRLADAAAATPSETGGSDPDEEEPAALFLDLVAPACGLGPEEEGPRLTVFVLNDYGRGGRGFLRRLEALRRDPALPPCAREMEILDLSATLGPEHFYILDDHLRPAGHRAVARRLLEAL